MNYEEALRFSKVYNSDLSLDLEETELNKLIGIRADLTDADLKNTISEVYHPLCGITELVGDPASGKTRLVLRILRKLLEATPQIKACLVDTENTSILSDREGFEEFLRDGREEGYLIVNQSPQDSSVSSRRASRICMNVCSVLLVGVSRTLCYAFYARLANLRGQNNIPLIWASHLANLARKHDLSIFVTSHVTTTYKDGECVIVPALGEFEEVLDAINLQELNGLDLFNAD